MNPRLRLRASAAAESALRAGHPWLYADSIRAQNRAGELGELAVIYDREDRFLAIGLYDPDSPLRVRILHQGKPAQIDEGWWRQRLRNAISRRDGLFDTHTTGFRWIHGESDGWPGLVLDRYGPVLVVKVYTAAWLANWDQIRSLLLDQLQPERLVLRMSRNIQPVARSRFQLQDGQVVFGPGLSDPVLFLETGLFFEAEVVRGQKTGFFLDQRENRRRVEALAHGRETLNVFSFSGGFSVYAARGGAPAVTDVDISPHALEASRRNFAANGADPRFRSCRHERVQADAFAWLEQAPPREFDLIILDPPSLAKREQERAGAIQAYSRLVRDAIKRLRPAGLLLACSCSAHVTKAEFFGAVREAGRRSGRIFSELATTGHPPDHPAGFAEAEYLKGIYLQVE